MATLAESHELGLGRTPEGPNTTPPAYLRFRGSAGWRRRLIESAAHLIHCYWTPGRRLLGSAAGVREAGLTGGTAEGQVPC